MHFKSIITEVFKGTVIRKCNLETLAPQSDDCPTAGYVKSFEVQVKCSYIISFSFFSFPPIYPYASLPATAMQSECEHGMCTSSPKQALRISQTFFFHCSRLQNKVVRTIPNCCGLLQPLWSCCHSFSFCRIRTTDKSHWHGLPL